ncbi:MAG TPA: OmpA family protein [Methylomirabilota bacterium]|nr:OmpA family protein [Methylomirabilota bacterium]
MLSLVRIGVVLPAVLVLLSGCATRDWVRELFVKKDAEIDQRFTRVEGQVQERVEGMGFRVTTLENSVGEVRQVALGARDRADGAFSRADGAFSRADEANSRLTRLWNNRHARIVVDTAEVRFGFDRWDLDDRAQTALLGLVNELKQNPKLTVELEGYADPVGSPGYNVELSRRRAEAVRRFLGSKGVEIARIHYIGYGSVADRGISDEKKRRVTVNLTAPSTE